MRYISKKVLYVLGSTILLVTLAHRYRPVLQYYDATPHPQPETPFRVPRIDDKDNNTTPPEHQAAATYRHINTVDCYRLFDRGQQRLHNSYNYYAPLPEPPVITNCRDYLDAQGYPQHPASDEEAGFPIAFSLLVYKSFPQVQMLLRAIYQPQNIYCVHMDIKSNVKFKNQMTDLVSCFPNVFFASQSYNVIWGRMSVLKADLICMKDFLTRSFVWKYFINLTGQEYPLKTNLEMVKILKILDGTNFIHSNSATKSREEWLKRVNTSYAFADDGKATAMGTKGPMPYNLTYYKGRVHVVMTRIMVDYVVNHPVAKDLLQWLNDTMIPDETFFPTLYCNLHPRGTPSLCDLVAPQDVTRLKIFHLVEYPCRGKWVRGICIFGVGDLSFIYERGVKGPALFVNKFNAGYQSLALLCVNKLHMERTQMQRNNSIYLNTHTELRKLKYKLQLQFDTSWKLI